jgi:hypothetical protein
MICHLRKAGAKPMRINESIAPLLDLAAAKIPFLFMEHVPRCIPGLPELRPSKNDRMHRHHQSFNLPRDEKSFVELLRAILLGGAQDRRCPLAPSLMALQGDDRDCLAPFSSHYPPSAHPNCTTVPTSRVTHVVT